MASESFKPPKAVQRAAARGLELRRKFGRGGTQVGVARARDLSNARSVSFETIKRMRSYFARHAVDAKAKGSESRGYWGDDSNASAGWIAWLLWGGDPGRDWVDKVYAERGPKANVKKKWKGPQPREGETIAEVFDYLISPEGAIYGTRRGGHMLLEGSLERARVLPPMAQYYDQERPVDYPVVDFLGWMRISSTDATIQAPRYVTKAQLDALMDVILAHHRASEAAESAAESERHSDYAQFLVGEVEQEVTPNPVGKRLPDALYVHESALVHMPDEFYETVLEAMQYIDDETPYDLVKVSIHRGQPAGAVSFLSYPGFDTEAHPELALSTRVDLDAGEVKVRDYSTSKNPPILHRKETFVAEDYPGRLDFVELTRAEEELGLLSSPRIGFRNQWEALLQQEGLEIVGHEVYEA